MINSRVMKRIRFEVRRRSSEKDSDKFWSMEKDNVWSKKKEYVQRKIVINSGVRKKKITSIGKRKMRFRIRISNSVQSRDKD